MNKQVTCFVCVFGLFALLVGCGGSMTATRTIRAGNLTMVTAQNKGPFHDDKIEQINVAKEEEACHQKWAMTLPEEVSTDADGAERYQVKVEAIVARCEVRADAGLAMALGASVPYVAPLYGGAVVGNGSYFPGYAASAPVIFPGGHPGQASLPSKALAAAQRDIRDLAGSQGLHEIRINELEGHEQPPPTPAESEAQ